MSKLTTEIPFTELVERVVSLGRANQNAYEKVRGIVQDIYTRDIPTKHDWQFLFASSAITTTEEYKTGTVSINTGTQGAGFSSDVSATAAMVGRKIKFSGNEVVYDVNSFMGTTSLQILPPFQGNSNIASGTYTIFQPTYALSVDFDRFPKDGGVYKWSGGRKEIMSESPYQEYAEDYSGQPSTPSTVRLVGQDTAGNQLVEFSPPPKDARVYSYDYLRRVYPMKETTQGLIKGISANATTVVSQTNGLFVHGVGSDSSVMPYAFFRVTEFGKGADSEWHKALAVISNSDITLRSAFGNSAVTTANYAFCTTPAIPTMLHPAILYGSVAQLLLDQGDDKAVIYLGRYAQVLSDAKRIYVTRTYSQDIHGIHEEYDYRR